jgi:hypothetical protein
MPNKFETNTFCVSIQFIGQEVYHKRHGLYIYNESSQEERLNELCATSGKMELLVDYMSLYATHFFLFNGLF